jgi:hypothetical protein
LNFDFWFLLGHSPQMDTDGHGCSRSRGWRIVLIVAVCVVAAIVLLWPRGEREPVYQGKKLSEWIKGASLVPAQPDLEKRREALRHMGTNTLPFLVRWIDGGEPPKLSRFDATAAKVRGPLGSAWTRFRRGQVRRAGDSVWAFSVLGASARPAVPELVALSHSTNRYVVINALGALYGVAENREKVFSEWIGRSGSTNESAPIDPDNPKGQGQKR